MIHYLAPTRDPLGMVEYLGHWGRDLADRVRIVSYIDLPATTRFEPGTYILSGLGQLGPQLRRLVVELRRQLSPLPGFRFLNDPERTLGRFELLTELHRRGLNSFRVIRAADDLSPLRYPVFLRADRTHDGAISPLLGSAREVEAALGRALLRGRRIEDLLVVEFSETTFADGSYRKYNAFFVGDRVIPRGLVTGSDWMLKENRGSRTRATEEEQLEYVTGNPHAAELAPIRDLAGVGYGRIDYTIRDGRVETWEINLNPRIGRGARPSRRNPTPEVRAIRTRTKECFYPAFRAALEAVDAHGGREATPTIDDTLRAAAGADPGVHRPTPGGGLARYLEPARPALETLAGGILPWIGRLARRRPGPLSGR